MLFPWKKKSRRLSEVLREKTAYEDRKRRLKLIRDMRGAWLDHVRRDGDDRRAYGRAITRYCRAQDRLKQFFDDHCPSHLRPPTRYETRMNYLHRRGLKGVWER